MTSQDIIDKINTLVNSISAMQIELIQLKNLVIQKEMEDLDSQYLDQAIKKVSPTTPIINGNGKPEKLFDF
ncbi:hypothetical protein PCC7424_5504 (plasmid) [Gloeothece citriformis PCC 7424]|uniref:Uncharacterized protein n=1 Tax=Gloeothece citriformis (strain PCC 7424) TaxID=65393 RepID=B7KMQ1_GLOC7|nr:hypothetical protein [Gloeothece citriformis]ACK74073.1 hypothetical protein PCC7424_5504 [Gloeothece citriformis PCC 7424]